MPTDTQPDLTALLEKHFGFRTFRPLQEDIVNTVLRKEHCLVVMPTGSGKSLCFQVPALCQKGLTLVISPLIALMKDQVDSLRANGIQAAFLNSSQSMAEQEKVKADIRSGSVPLLYIAPERLAAGGFSEFLADANIQLLAIDEAHCISEWGHEFRPDYRNLRGLRSAFPSVPCIALTATATPKVQADIREQLMLPDARLFLSSFNRPNLLYHVYPKSQSFERLLLILRSPQRLPAIVYCFSRRDTEMLAEDLKAEGLSALPYHAGLDTQTRRETQEKFMRDQVSVITATIAFGMGIDKPDVRTVVHMDLPKNIEGYYQETGRAGRDGLPSDCVLFFSYGDKFKQEYFIEQMENPDQQSVARDQLEKMLEYGSLRTCRRNFLLSYFGERTAKKTCNGCDRCLQKGETFDATEITQKILSAVLRTGERFGAAHICDVLLGKNKERIRSFHHDQLSIFGSVQEFDDRQLRDIIAELLDKEFLLKASGQYPTLSLTENGKKAIIERQKIELRKPEEAAHVTERATLQDELPYDAALFEQLRVLRRDIAEKQGVAAFVIFGDRSLREMATFFPQRSESFAQIYGVSDRKLEQFGQRFLAIIQSFAAVHNLQERAIPASAQYAAPRLRKSKILRQDSTYQETRTLIERKRPLADIARERNLKEGTIVQHIEELIMAGVPLDIGYLRPEAAVFDPIASTFRSCGGEALAPVFQALEGKYSYDTVRLVRIFLHKKSVDAV